MGKQSELSGATFGHVSKVFLDLPDLCLPTPWTTLPPDLRRSPLRLSS